MRHEIFVPEALREAAARATKEILANGQGHAIAADTFFSNIIETNRMMSPASYKRKARIKILSHLYRMALPGFKRVRHARSIMNVNAHANRRAPPGRNPGGGRKREQN